MHSVQICQQTVRLKFLGRMSIQYDGNGLWKKDTKKEYPSLRSVRDGKQEARRYPKVECCFYRECRFVLKGFTRVKDDLSVNRLLSPKTLYRVLLPRWVPSR